MKTILHKANTRGQANHGWLQSQHSFSFGNYHDPERMNFGMLRVLNDDVVQPGMGFATHTHKNMEIISIPLQGDLEHKDSMGNTTVIKQGDVQVMSTGKVISHSEYNKNIDREVKFLQIWVIPNKNEVEPRYNQITITNTDSKNRFIQVLSPNSNDDGVWIYQNAWFYLGEFEKGHEQTYEVNDKSNGIYVFVLEGNSTIERQNLNKRDGLGIRETDKITITADSDTKLLVMEVPMTNY